METTMNTDALRAWAELHAEGPVAVGPDYHLSLSSKLVRFPWNNAMTVAVGADAGVKTRINAVLDALTVALEQPERDGASVHLLLGMGPDWSNDPTIREPLGAIGTLVSQIRNGPDLRVWTLAPGAEPIETTLAATVFTTTAPARWSKMLMTAATTAVTGMAADVTEALRNRPSFALYPKLSTLNSAEPWQMRLDGLEIGRTGPITTTVHLTSTDLTKPGEPRTTWRNVVGHDSIVLTADRVPQLVRLVDRLIAAWTNTNKPHAVLRHGQAEHALEAHLLSGRLTLTASPDRLRPAVPSRSGILAGAQFPTLWGDVTRPARYLDALLADRHHRPWAVELKDQDAGGGHGAYLRHGIGQAVLYRHYIRSVTELDPWFDLHGLNRTHCQGALAFPMAAPSTANVIERLRVLAALYDVAVIEFPRPG
jgi:hypothetical protein